MTLSPVLKHKAVLLLALMLGLVVLLAPSYAHAGWFSWVTGVIDIPDLLGKFFYLIATTLGGAVLYLGSLLLDYSVFYLVVQMGTFFQSGAQFGQAVALGWTLIRDLINMTFIFGLIYIGIKTILNSEDADTRRKLGYLIIAALLINFSLFMTQLVVDFSNLLATQMYSQLSQPGPAGSVPSISGAFMNASKVSSYINTQTIQQGETAKPAISGSALIVYSVMLLIFYVFAGISFLMGSFLIVSRFVALILYMIFSPVMFLGWILPQFKSYSSTWWEGFWKNCIFAPIYLFILYISLQVLRGLTSTGVLATSANSGSLDMVGKATQAAQTSIGQIVISFMIMIGLLWASQKIGEKLSISGGKMTMNGFTQSGRWMGRGLGRAGGAMTFGALGGLGRTTVGRVANRYANSDFGERMAMRNRLGGRAILAADAVRNASFDARNVKGMEAANLGKGRKGGFVQRESDAASYANKVAKFVEKDTRLYEDAGLMDVHEGTEAYNAQRSKLTAKLAITSGESQRKDLKAQIDKLKTGHEGKFTKKQRDDYEKMKKGMKTAAKNQLAELYENKGLIPRLLTGRSKAEMKAMAEAIRKDTGRDDVDKLSDSLKKALKGAEKKDGE